MATLPRHPRADHFWSYVDFGDGSGCWTWKRSLNRRGGYGKFIADGREYKAHRFAWELVNGPIPDGMLICHHCDNPPCVRPDHLFLGTPKDNRQDSITKGRWVGRLNTKITADDVLEMRAMKESGYIQQEIADRFGIHRTFVSKVLNGKRWGRVE